MPPTAPTASVACGRCGRPVPVTAWTTWCQACDWNVVTSPEPPPARLLERWQRRIAQRVGARRYAELVAGRPAGLLERAAGALLLLLSMIVHLTTLGLLTLLVWAVLAAPSGLWRWTALAGSVAVTYLAFPRPRPLNGAVVVLTREQAPGLWGLVDQTAAAMGSRPPALLGVDRDLNAYATRSGWGWRSTVIFGLPLWSALQPQERVAVLAHELGHLGHGDVRRMVVVTLATDCVQAMFDVLWPDDVDEEPIEDIAVLAVVALPLRRLLALPLLGILLLMAQLSAWSEQRQEYLADLAGAGVAGTDAARAALLRALGLPGVQARMQSAVRRRDDLWQTLGTAPAPDAWELRRLLRESELIGHQLDAGHPPTHLRVQLISATPAASAAVVLDQGRQLLIERELAPVRERLTERLTDDLLE